MGLLEIYRKLLNHFGKQNWWPADSEFEMIVGAILTQCTSWKNVERVMENMKAKELINPKHMMEIDRENLRRIIKPVGYYNSKTEKLKAFVEFLYNRYNGDLYDFLAQPLPLLRKQLLSIYGIGPETADSIILYAANKPSFVVDAYTVRIFSRLGFIDKDTNYDKLKRFFEENLPRDVELYKEYHALIDELGKNFCRKEPHCKKCPLNEFCGFANSY